MTENEATALAALKSAEDALDTMRRGHGVDHLCYPALNLVRDAIEKLEGREPELSPDEKWPDVKGVWKDLVAGAEFTMDDKHYKVIKRL